MKRLICFTILLCYLVVLVLSSDVAEEFCSIDGECKSHDGDRASKYLSEDEESYKKCKSNCSSCRLKIKCLNQIKNSSVEFH